jgi:hypothetical protein
MTGQELIDYIKEKHLEDYRFRAFLGFREDCYLNEFGPDDLYVFNNDKLVDVNIIY